VSVDSALNRERGIRYAYDNLCEGAVVSDLGQHIETVVFQPGEILFLENESSFHFYIIQDGEVEVFRTNPDGEITPLATIRAGSSIGEFAMLDRQRRSASARAVTEVHAAKISETAYHQLLQDLPDWAISVMRGLVQRIRHMNQILSESQSMDRKTTQMLQSTEYDDTETFLGTNPFLGNPDETD
jgi:CRP-like cAMP-binding protein